MLVVRMCWMMRKWVINMSQHIQYEAFEKYDKNVTSKNSSKCSCICISLTAPKVNIDKQCHNSLLHMPLLKRNAIMKRDL